jgi:hypothetical protein
MKTAKRVLAILLAMLMAVSTLAVAASAADSIASQLASGNTASISQNTRESVVITKDATIDLGGKILKSVPGSPAITVKNGATVTIKNGYVESYFENYSGVTPELLDRIGRAAPSAIVAYGAGTKVVLEDVRALGGLIRIPTTTEWFFPVGSALKIYSGAEAELNGAVLVGSYAISNDPAKTGRPDATVTINEGILFGYIDYIKRVTNDAVIVPETVEKVNAASRIEGYLNDGVALTAGERDLLKKAMDDRVYLFTQKPVDDTALVTFDENDDSAIITASTVEHLTREDGGHKNTDCCYKYVPESAYDAETKETYELNHPYEAVELEGKEIRINYRLEFELKGDFKKLADKLKDDQSMEFFRRYYNKAVSKADSVYKEAIKTYDKYIDKLVKLYKDIDAAGEAGVTLNGQIYTLSNELGDNFYAILRSILSLGGVSVYKKATGLDLTTLAFTSKDPLYNRGANAPKAGTYDVDPDSKTTESYKVNGQWVDVDVYTITRLGPLDRIDPVVEEFKAIKGDASLGDQTKWIQYAHLAIDNYHDMLKVFEEAETALRDFQKLLDTNSTIKALVEEMKMDDQVKEITKLADAARDAKAAVKTATDNSIVKTFMNKIDANANNGTVETYVNKVKGAVNNYRKYFKAEDFVTDDEFGIAYIVTGPTDTYTIPRAKLHVSVLGDGKVNYVPDTVAAGVAKNTDYPYSNVSYSKTVTLTAVAEAGNEFLYYMASDTQRIISTNPTLVIDTQIDRYVDAVFESTAKSMVIFTNRSGVICGDLPYADAVDTSSIDVPAYQGYDSIGWGPKGSKTLTATDYVSAYQYGNSAFESGANYKIFGYAFKLNRTTANKYLVTPKYTAAQTFEISFNDNGEVWSKTAKIGDSVTYTATGDNFAYWKNDKGQIVSVYPTYEVQAIQPATLTAVYNATAADTGYVNIVAAVQEDTRVRLYSERSIPANRKVLSNGVIISFTDDIQIPRVEDIDGENVIGKYSTLKTNQGVYATGLKNTTIEDYPTGIFVCAFVELQTATGSEFIYSDPYSTLS